MSDANLELGLGSSAHELNYPLLLSNEYTSTPSFDDDTLSSSSLTSWTPGDLEVWLDTTLEFKQFKRAFADVDGRELSFMTVQQIRRIMMIDACSYGGGDNGIDKDEVDGLALKLYTEVRFLRYNFSITDVKANFNGDTSDVPKIQKNDFPPLLYLPRLSTTLVFLVLATLTTLSLTIFSKQTEKVTHTSIKTITLYASIPLIASIFTYTHIYFALWLTFFPITFKGCGQIKGTNVGVLGWQGIIPFKAEKMARMSVRLMTEKLIDVKEEFSKIDVEVVSAKMETIMVEKLSNVIEDVFTKHQPKIWSMASMAVRDEMILSGMEKSPVVVQSVMNDIKENITTVFDIENFVVTFLKNDVSLLNEVFIKCGWQELCFIRDCGLHLGFVFGVVQMVIWIPIHPIPADDFLHPGARSLLTFLLIGLIVGSLTNYLALKIIFAPINPIRLPFGYTLQGLFLKRQNEISRVYAKLCANDVLNARNIVNEMLHGKDSTLLHDIVRKHLEVGCDEFIGVTVLTYIRKGLGNEVVENMRNDAVSSIITDLPSMITGVGIEDYLNEALDLENTLYTKMSALRPGDFERLLHPVFEEDEWKLILMGGVLGVLIGGIQSFLLN